MDEGLLLAHLDAEAFGVAAALLLRTPPPRRVESLRKGLLCANPTARWHAAAWLFRLGDAPPAASVGAMAVDSLLLLLKRSLRFVFSKRVAAELRSLAQTPDPPPFSAAAARELREAIIADFSTVPPSFFAAALFRIVAGAEGALEIAAGAVAALRAGGRCSVEAAMTLSLRFEGEGGEEVAAAVVDDVVSRWGADAPPQELFRLFAHGVEASFILNLIQKRRDADPMMPPLFLKIESSPHFASEGRELAVAIWDTCRRDESAFPHFLIKKALEGASANSFAFASEISIRFPSLRPFLVLLAEVPSNRFVEFFNSVFKSQNTHPLEAAALGGVAGVPVEAPILAALLNLVFSLDVETWLRGRDALVTRGLFLETIPPSLRFLSVDDVAALQNLLAARPFAASLPFASAEGAMAHAVAAYGSIFRIAHDLWRRCKEIPVDDAGDVALRFASLRSLPPPFKREAAMVLLRFASLRAADVDVAAAMGAALSLRGEVVRALALNKRVLTKEAFFYLAAIAAALSDDLPEDPSLRFASLDLALRAQVAAEVGGGDAGARALHGGGGEVLGVCFERRLDALFQTAAQIQISNFPPHFDYLERAVRLRRAIGASPPRAQTRRRSRGCAEVLAGNAGNVKPCQSLTDPAAAVSAALDPLDASTLHSLLGDLWLTGVATQFSRQIAALTERAGVCGCDALIAAAVARAQAAAAGVPSDGAEFQICAEAQAALSLRFAEAFFGGGGGDVGEAARNVAVLQVLTSKRSVAADAVGRFAADVSADPPPPLVRALVRHVAAIARGVAALGPTLGEGGDFRILKMEPLEIAAAAVASPLAATGGGVEVLLAALGLDLAGVVAALLFAPPRDPPPHLREDVGPLFAALKFKFGAATTFAFAAAAFAAGISAAAGEVRSCARVAAPLRRLVAARRRRGEGGVSPRGVEEATTSATFRTDFGGGVESVGSERASVCGSESSDDSSASDERLSPQTHALGSPEFCPPPPTDETLSAAVEARAASACLFALRVRNASLCGALVARHLNSWRANAAALAAQVARARCRADGALRVAFERAAAIFSARSADSAWGRWQSLRLALEADPRRVVARMCAAGRFDVARRLAEGWGGAGGGGGLFEFVDAQELAHAVDARDVAAAHKLATLRGDDVAGLFLEQMGRCDADMGAALCAIHFATLRNSPREEVQKYSRAFRVHNPRPFASPPPPVDSPRAGPPPTRRIGAPPPRRRRHFREAIFGR
jgi:hypothetical protein